MRQKPKLGQSCLNTKTTSEYYFSNNDNITTNKNSEMTNLLITITANDYQNQIRDKYQREV